MRSRVGFAVGAAAAVASLLFAGAARFSRLAAVPQATAGDDLSIVAFAGSGPNPGESEINAMLRSVVKNSLGENGWAALVGPNDRVVIKVNLVGPHRGSRGMKGKAIDTDPRLVKAVARAIRTEIGDEGDIVVTDALFYPGANPSDPAKETSFYRSGYDDDGDGILDGGSRARLVNADSYGKDRRFLTVVDEPVLGKTSVWLPDFMRPRESPSSSGEYADVVVYMPVFKSHGFTGITGALKLSYGLRTEGKIGDDFSRANHSGYGWGTGNKELLVDYLCAQSRARKCDFVVMDALTANRKGPLNVNEIDVNAPTDWLATDAILASRDPVAIDTVECLFAGYDPDSIALLKAASRDGLGEARASRILVTGGESFGRHRAAIAARFAPQKRFGHERSTWPLEDGWGGARVKTDIAAPAFGKIVANPIPGGRIRVDYAVGDSGWGATGISRVDLLIGGELASSVLDSPASGSFELAQREIPSGRPDDGPRVELVAWDGALNAARANVTLDTGGEGKEGGGAR
jgi:uncharacterized protein (DUF362 family)